MAENPKSAGWEYRCTQPALPPDAISPIMDSRQMTDWLNSADMKGWEFVGYGAKHWHGSDVPQSWWVFRRPRNGK